MLKTLFRVILLLGSLQVMAQDCDSNMNFLIRKIKTNYAGYADKNGDSVVVSQLKDWKKRFRDTGDCFSKLAHVLLGFRDPHMYMYSAQPLPLPDSLQLNRQLKEIRQYFSGKSKVNDPCEGYWISGTAHYIIAIRRTKTSPLEYTGYVIESRNDKCPPGSEKFILTAFDKTYFQTTVISGGRYKASILSRFDDTHALLMGVSAKWRKLDRYMPDMLNGYPLYDIYPSLTIRDSETVVIRIPSAGYDSKRKVDSLVKAHKDRISSSRNLIVDIRNNTGGTTLTFYSLLPFILTRPVVALGGRINCSEDVIADHRKGIEQYGEIWTATQRVEQEKVLQELIARKGGFYEEKIDTLACDTVSKYPVNVGIIANYASASASEMFMSYCKQSSKVTLFGERTWGVLDYVEYIDLAMPGNRFTLYVPRLKIIYPDGSGPHDNIGFKPDVEIDDAVPDWVKFIQEYYKKTIN